MENKQNDKNKYPPIAPSRLDLSELYFLSHGLKDPNFMADLVDWTTRGEAAVHCVYYTLDELKMMVNSPMDNVIIHKIKRYMHLITCNDNLPGEIFRTYPICLSLATLEFRDFLAYRNYNGGILDDKNINDKRHKYNLECSNFGRIKIDGKIIKPIEEKPGWLYIHVEDQKYPVYRIVAETWCLCPSNDSSGWQVHHISNDGYDNTPGNLIWIKGDAHKKIGTPREQKLKIQFDNDDAEIKRIIEELNSQE